MRSLEPIERRIAALEGESAPARISCIVRRIVDPGRQPGEVHQLRSYGGVTWARATGETEAAFVERAAGDQRAANPKAIPRLIGEA